MLYLLEVDGIVAAAAAGFVLGVGLLIFLAALAFRGAKLLATGLYHCILIYKESRKFS